MSSDGENKDIPNKGNDISLQHIMDLLPIRIFWKDRDLNFLGCNMIFAKDAGLESPEKIIGKNDYELPWKDQADLYRGDDKDVINNNKQKLNIEEPQTTLSGETIWLSTSKVPLTDEHGNIIGVLGVYADVTEKKASDLRIKALLDELQQFQNATIDRELKVIEMKKEVNQLSKELGKDEPYDLSFLDEDDK